MSRSRIFLIFCLSFILGVLVAPLMTNIVTAAAAVIFIMLICVWWDLRIAKIIGLTGLIMVLGSLRFASVTNQNNLKSYYDNTVQIRGVVIEEPDIREDKIYLTLGKLSVDGTQVYDKILVSMYPNHNFYYGDEMSFTGKIQEPAVFDDFNYKNYLSRYGIDAVMYYPDFEVISSDRGNKIKGFLLSIKQRFSDNLAQVLPEPQNGLLAGILVGAKRSIPEDLSDKFGITGTSHIVAISGYNITIIIWALEIVLRRFGKKLSSLLSLVAIVAFVVLTGGAASAIRAAAIAALGLVALNIGRLNNITNAMAATAAIMILWNPKILLYDVGFELSFLALCGLVYLSPKLTWKSKYIPDWVGTTFAATMAAQIFTIPILLFNFGQLSLVAPLTNVLVLGVIPYIMGFGFALGAITFVWQALAAALAWVLWILLSYVIEIVDLTSYIPLASMAIRLELWSVIVYYVALIALLWRFRLYKHEEFL